MVLPAGVGFRLKLKSDVKPLGLVPDRPCHGPDNVFEDAKVNHHLFAVLCLFPEIGRSEPDPYAALFPGRRPDEYASD